MRHALIVVAISVRQLKIYYISLPTIQKRSCCGEVSIDRKTFAI